MSNFGLLLLGILSAWVTVTVAFLVMVWNDDKHPSNKR